jgi:hypothetical protein
MRTRILYNGGMSASPKLPRIGPTRKRCACGCGKLFVPKRKWQKFFSLQCKDNYHNLGPAFGKLEHRGLERLVKLALEQLKPKLPAMVKAHLAALLVKEQDQTIAELRERIENLERHASQTAQV